LSVVLVVLAGGGAALFFYSRLQEPFKGYAGGEQFVDIPSGMTAGAIGERLVSAGIVRDQRTFQLAMHWMGRGKSLQAGEYRFDRPLTPAEVIEKLARGDVYLHAITFPEGLTLDEMAEIFEREGFGTRAAFMEAARNPRLVNSWDPAAQDLEGYLFPSTYRVARRTTAAELVRLMVRGFEKAFGPELRKEAAAANLTVRQAVTLASLIEKETARPDERFLTSAVYRNRLKIGMGMQCDPTVIYALRRAGKYTGNITREDLTFDSPYNTYRYAGLPPGPIAAPGAASLEAAVRPADVPYLYFVSRNDGSHVFATTLAEHNRNVYQYQILYFREKRRQGS
jgi:UPF0755 protein